MASHYDLLPAGYERAHLRDYSVPPVALRTEIRTDASGSYTAIVFDDGHIETDPPGRPLFKEDLRRKALSDAALANGASFLRAANAAGDSTSADRQAAASGRAIAPGFHDTLAALAELATTFTSTPAMRKFLIGNVDLGGPVQGANAGKQPEYGAGIRVDSTAMLPPTAVR